MKKFVSVFLLLLVVGVLRGMVQRADILLTIDGRPVTVTEYEAFRQLVHASRESFADGLDDFVDFKLKAVEASRMGCDTLTSFSRLLDALSSEVNCASQSRGLNRINIQRGGWVKVEMLTIPVRQDASDETLRAACEEMETVRRKAQTDAHFTLATQAEGRIYRDGMRWLPVEWCLPEEMNAIRETAAGQYSKVFVSSLGVNLLKVTDRTDDYSRTLDEKQMMNFPLRDIVLSMYWDNMQPRPTTKENISEKQLADFFKRNAKLYAFDLPHYKGVVVYCSDKHSEKTIKRRLKKVAYDQWPERIEQLKREKKIGDVQSEYGLFRIGSNDAVDSKVFKCIELPENRQYPYLLVKGKVLKSVPESFRDVEDKVVADYLREQEKMRLDALRQKHVVEIVDQRFR